MYLIKEHSITRMYKNFDAITLKDVWENAFFVLMDNWLRCAEWALGFGRPVSCKVSWSGCIYKQILAWICLWNIYSRLTDGGWFPSHNSCLILTQALFKSFPFSWLQNNKQKTQKVNMTWPSGCPAALSEWGQKGPARRALASWRGGGLSPQSPPYSL